MESSGMITDNTDKNNPFTHRVQTYIFREIGDKKQPWKNDFQLYFGDKDTGIVNFNKSDGYIKMQSIQVPANVISPSKYRELNTIGETHKKALASLLGKNVAFKDVFALKMYPYRVDYDILKESNAPLYTLKDQGTTAYDDYNQNPKNVPLFSSPTFDVINSIPILTRESKKLLTVLNLVDSNERIINTWSDKIAYDANNREYLNDKTCFLNNHYNNYNNVKFHTTTVEVFNFKTNVVLDKLNNSETVTLENSSLGVGNEIYLGDDISTGSIGFINFLQANQITLNNSTKLLELSDITLQAMSANKYTYKQNLHIPNLPDYFKSRIGLEEKEHTNVGLCKNLAYYITELKDIQKKIDTTVFQLKKIVQQPIISFDIVFLNGSVTSYKQTVKYNSFVNQAKGNYKHAYKILVLYVVAKLPDGEQNLSSKYPLISIKRVSIIKHFHLTPNSKIGTFIRIPSHFVPGFKKLFPLKETGFKETNKVDSFIKNKKLEVPLNHAIQTKFTVSEVAFECVTLPLDVKIPIIYEKDMRDDPDMLPFFIENNTIIERTHNVFYANPLLEGLYPLGDFKLEGLESKDVNIDMFANKTGLADYTIVPDRTNKGYVFKEATEKLNQLPIISNTIHNNINSFNTRYLHSLEFLCYTNISERCYHTGSKEFFSFLDYFTVPKIYKAQTFKEDYYQTVFGKNYRKIIAGELGEGSFYFTRLNSGHEINLQYDKGQLQPDLPFKNLIIKLSNRINSIDMNRHRVNETTLILDTQQVGGNSQMLFSIDQEALQSIIRKVTIPQARGLKSSMYLWIKNILLPSAIKTPNKSDIIYIMSEDLVSSYTHTYVDVNGTKTDVPILAHLNATSKEFVNKKDINDVIEISFDTKSADILGHHSNIIPISNAERLLQFSINLVDQDLKLIEFHNKHFPIRFEISLQNVIWY